MVILPLIVISACEKEPVEQMPAPVVRQFDQASIDMGFQIFQQHCRRCHGDEAQGDPKWRQPGADGKYPPPPLNGTGHAWHHPVQWLFHTIKHGSQNGQGNMPAWASMLSDEEIQAVIDWFQSLWPDEVYAAWYDMDRRSRSR
ncbi:MAG: c-type cytochrome [Gammaproteobacteria bacterium]